MRYNKAREAGWLPHPAGPTRDIEIEGRESGGRDVAQPPEVLAMVLCDLVITDAETNKKSLIGLFDRVETAAMPCVLHELNIYLCLTDGHGVLPVAVACIAEPDGEELFRGETTIAFQDPLQVVELHFVFPSARFPRAGEYRFQFLAGDTLLRERKFFVSYADDRLPAPEC
ncbi:MAG: hypothetical protein IRY99_02665 [Isosphaeraceae bacterium]|nr:hypothetical protein [Isosphaeraceae bacterium]